MNYEEVINDPCGSIDDVSLFVESPTIVEETRICLKAN